MRRKSGATARPQSVNNSVAELFTLDLRRLTFGINAMHYSAVVI